MQNLDCNQIKIFINLEIIGEENKNKKIISIFFYSPTNFVKGENLIVGGA